MPSTDRNEPIGTDKDGSTAPIKPTDDNSYSVLDHSIKVSGSVAKYEYVN